MTMVCVMFGGFKLVLKLNLNKIFAAGMLSNQQSINDKFMHQQINFAGGKICIIAFIFNLTKNKIKLFLRHVK